MDGSVDLKILLTIAGMLVSVVAAAAVAKREIERLRSDVDQLKKEVQK